MSTDCDVRKSWHRQDLMKAFRQQLLREQTRSILAGIRFGARAFAQNFSEEELLAGDRLRRICMDRKIYLTVNTLVEGNRVGRTIICLSAPLL